MISTRAVTDTPQKMQRRTPARHLLLLGAALHLSGAAEMGAQKPETKPVKAAETSGSGASREAVDALSDADLGQVIPLLREHFVNAEALTDTEVSRATVQGLLERLMPGARLDPPATGMREPSAFRSELIEGRIGYARLGSITAANQTQLDGALQAFAAKKATALVLDLRATPASNDFTEAAKICERFSPKGRVLFTLKKPNANQETIVTSKEEPRFRGVLAVLIDHDTAGAAEVVAAVLRAQVKAMVIGQNTRGEAAEYASLALPSGKLLRVAVAEIALPEGVTIFPDGVKPDLQVEVPQETTDAVLKTALEKGVSDLVLETERPRMNEAALVAGTNPELDALAAQRARGDKAKVAPLRDAALQRAVDFITTIGIYEKAGATK